MFNPAVLHSLRTNTLSILDCAELGIVPPPPLRGHTECVLALTALPDGMLASGSDDETIRIWNVHSGDTLRVLSGHTGSVYALTALSDGRLVSGSEDKTIRIWNTHSGETLRVLSGHVSLVRAFAVLSDGRLASGSEDKTIRIWNTLSGEPLRVLSGHIDSVLALTVLPDGTLASGSWDRTIRIWNTDPRNISNFFSKEMLRVLSGHTGGVRALAVLSDGRLASGSADKTIRIWDVHSGATLNILSGDIRDQVQLLTALPDGRLASGYWSDKTIRIWNAVSGETLRVWSGDISAKVHALTALPDGRLASGSGSIIHIWPLVSRALFGTLQTVLSGNTSLVGLEYKEATDRTVASYLASEAVRVAANSDALSRLSVSDIGRDAAGWLEGVAQRNTESRVSAIASWSADVFLSDEQKAWLEDVVRRNLAARLSVDRAAPLASVVLPVPVLPRHLPSEAGGVASNKESADRTAASWLASTVVGAAASAPPSHLLSRVDGAASTAASRSISAVGTPVDGDPTIGSP